MKKRERGSRNIIIVVIILIVLLFGLYFYSDLDSTSEGLLSQNTDFSRNLMDFFLGAFDVRDIDLDDVDPDSMHPPLEDSGYCKDLIDVRQFHKCGDGCCPAGTVCAPNKNNNKPACFSHVCSRGGVQCGNGCCNDDRQCVLKNGEYKCEPLNDHNSKGTRCENFKNTYSCGNKPACCAIDLEICAPQANNNAGGCCAVGTEFDLKTGTCRTYATDKDGNIVFCGPVILPLLHKCCKDKKDGETSEWICPTTMDCGSEDGPRPGTIILCKPKKGPECGKIGPTPQGKDCCSDKGHNWFCPSGKCYHYSLVYDKGICKS